MDLFITTPLFSVHIVRWPKGQGAGWSFERRRSHHPHVGQSVLAYLGRVQITATAERRKDLSIQW
ncbi:hypothetical protein ACERNI_06525 [Camelimonas sp. ID_303_24]